MLCSEAVNNVAIVNKFVIDAIYIAVGLLAQFRNENLRLNKQRFVVLPLNESLTSMCNSVTAPRNCAVSDCFWYADFTRHNMTGNLVRDSGFRV